MAATAQVNISGSIVNLPGGTEGIGPFSDSSSAAVGQVQQVAVAATTFVALAVPSVPVAPTRVLIEIPAGSAAMTLKGITGDTGIVLPAAPAGSPLILYLPLGASLSIGLYNTGAATINVSVTWI